ncbi:flagellar hook-associated protein FlgK [Thauera sp.]|jgi:flagellar hook-associated protein 1 FlgK|uniref:flagellar hook-associated protein FlgK n=1 Tax=Thauera sp. TaxID=1905334 RepID=UPI002A3610A9|nr:flagellar hook-associated protein FlgK [Thauera sp.]MDX9884904.1 flagellar hook-associated protein FlgK [Thauera sp.]
MSSLLNIGLTGLNASQAYLNTTSHNIANAATPGYHRQSVTQQARDPQFLGGAFFGTGTAITGVKRSYSELLETQVMNADSRRAEFAAYNRFISQVDNVLADSDTGLTPALNEFFGALQSVSSNPTNVAARQALISTGETLVSRFNTLDALIGEIAQGVETDMASTMASINSYAGAIAELNQRIAVSQATGFGSAANDLLDQRGQAIAELNTLVKVNAVPQRDGSLSIFIGSGQALVLGTNAKQLSMGDTLDEKGRPMVMISGPNGTQTPLAENLISGGELGGLLAVRRDGLEPAQRSLGLIAATIATAFNEQHKLGVDLEGALGGDFFRVGSARIEPADSGVEVAINPAKLAELTGADYELRKDGGAYTLVDIATGKGSPLAVAGGDATFAGLDFSGLDGMVDGDKVFVYPTRYAAGTIGMEISDPRDVAAAAPVLANLPSANTGSLKVQSVVFAGVKEDAAGTSLSLPSLSYTFDQATNAFELVPAVAGWTGTLAYDPATDSTGKTFEVTNADGVKIELKISGVPADNDVVTLDDNKDGIADNRNAALLGALQTDKLMFGAGGSADRPTATLNNAYAQLVAKVGSKAREVQAGERTQSSLLAQATAARDSVSGVNLDEEAANLVRFQQTYQAAGRVMSVAQRLFDEMLAIGR